MKKVAAILLLIGALSTFGIAQSGRRERRIEAQPTPTPVAPQVEDSSNVSDSVPRTQRSKEQPTLRRGGNSTPNPTTQNQTSSPSTPTSGEVISDDTEVLRVETSVVTIPVTVIDRQGRFVSGLQEEHFKIFEDGKEQQIAYFNSTELPFTVVLLLDVSNSTQFKIDEIQDAAISFVRELKDNDRVMVIAFDEKVNLLTKEPTNDRNKLISAIRRADFGGGTSLYDAVDHAINKALSRIEGRKAIVLFSDGVDTTSRRSSYDRTVRDSAELDATIYTIYYNTFRDMRSGGGGTIGNPYPRRGGIGGILGTILGGGNIQIGGGGGGGGTSRGEYALGERYLEDLAQTTGGRKYDANTTSNLETAFHDIAEELRRQYSLGYYPSETGKTGQRKQVKVRVNQPNLIVRARDSYVVTDPEAQSVKQNLVSGGLLK
jgi:VWFA-related protein